MNYILSFSNSVLNWPFLLESLSFMKHIGCLLLLGARIIFFIDLWKSMMDSDGARSSDH